MKEHQEKKQLKARYALYVELESYRAAEKLLLAYLEDMGESADILTLLGALYHKQSKFELALNQFEKALASDPTYVEASLCLSATLADLCCYDQAKLVYGKILTKKELAKTQVYKEISFLHGEIAELFERLGETDKAIHEYKNASGFAVKNTNDLLSVGKLYFESKQYQNAIEIFDRIITTDKQSYDAVMWKGLAEYKLGHRSLAHDSWAKAKALKPNSALASSYEKLSASWFSTNSI